MLIKVMLIKYLFKKNHMEIEFELWAEATFGKYDAEYFKSLDPIGAYIFVMALETKQLDESLTVRESEFLENGRTYFRSLPLDEKIKIWRGEDSLVGEAFRDEFILNV
jgi:hypothetical protein